MKKQIDKNVAVRHALGAKASVASCASLKLMESGLVLAGAAVVERLQIETRKKMGDFHCYVGAVDDIVRVVVVDCMNGEVGMCMILQMCLLIVCVALDIELPMSLLLVFVATGTETQMNLLIASVAEDTELQTQLLLAFVATDTEM
jgi:hypothetical protein